MIHRFGPVYQRHEWWHGVIGLIFWLAFLALIVMLVVWLVNGARHGHNHLHHGPHYGTLPPSPPSEDAALREARMRYARGELTRKQFLEISSDLGGAQTPQEPSSPSA
jgi:uncharacterized membrane protein